MRDTPYATQLAVAQIPVGESCAVAERIRVKETGTEEIRLSWWKGGRFMPRPLDVPEADLLLLLKEALKASVFSSCFVAGLRGLLDD